VVIDLDLCRKEVYNLQLEIHRTKDTIQHLTLENQSLRIKNARLKEAKVSVARKLSEVMEQVLIPFPS